jgi:hypothetical protein
LIAYLLCYLALIIAQDMSKDTSCISLPRRSSLLSSTKYHAAKSAQIVENASVVILFKRIIQILGTIGRCRVVRKSIKERGKCQLDSRTDRRRFRSNLLTDLADSGRSLFLTEKIL